MLANSGISSGQPAMGGGTTAAKAPTSTDPAAPGTYYAPPQGTDQAAEDYATANLAYQQALARFNQQRTGLLQQYGYKGTIDPTTGLITNIGVDAGNSYGQLQQLLHTQALDDQQAQYDAEDRGLVGGLANQGEQELSYQHHGQSTDLANTLFGSLSDLNNQQLDAKDTLDQALWQLQHGAVADAVSAGTYNPAATPSSGGSSSGSGSGSGAAAASHIGTIPTSVANALVKKAIAAGQPVSEHGLGQMKAAPAKAAPARYYTTKAEAKKAAGRKAIKFTAGKGYYVA